MEPSRQKGQNGRRTPQIVLPRSGYQAGLPDPRWAGMAIHQALGAFKLFTGEELDADRLIRHFDAMQ